MSKEEEKILEYERKIVQYKLACTLQPLFSIEWIKKNILKG